MVASLTRTSAGLLLYRIRERRLEVLIAHMGGPFWARKDEGGWSIVKGEYHAAREDAYAAARREFEEETGRPAPDGEPLALGELRQRSGKLISVWAIESDFDATQITSNAFMMEWPRGSGEEQQFPEIDRAAWFDCATARTKLVGGQAPFLDTLEQRLRDVQRRPA